jgi:hypothetical protein
MLVHTTGVESPRRRTVKLNIEGHTIEIPDGALPEGFEEEAAKILETCGEIAAKHTEVFAETFDNLNCAILVWPKGVTAIGGMSHTADKADETFTAMLDVLMGVAKQKLEKQAKEQKLENYVQGTVANA